MRVLNHPFRPTRWTAIPTWSLLLLLLLLLLAIEVHSQDKYVTQDQVSIGSFGVYLKVDTTSSSSGSGTWCTSLTASATRLAVQQCVKDLAPTQCNIDPLYIELSGEQCTSVGVRFDGGYADFTGATYIATQQQVASCIQNNVASANCLTELGKYMSGVTSMSFAQGTFPVTTTTPAPIPAPTRAPTITSTTPKPFASPTRQPVIIVSEPTPAPTVKPTKTPTTLKPTKPPTYRPSPKPTSAPSDFDVSGPTALSPRPSLPLLSASPTQAPLERATEPKDGVVSGVTGGNSADGGDNPTQNASNKSYAGIIAGTAIAGVILIVLLVGLEYKRRHDSENTQRGGNEPKAIGEMDASKDLGLSVQESWNNTTNSDIEVIVSPAPLSSPSDIMSGKPITNKQDNDDDDDEEQAKTQVGSLESDDSPTVSDSGPENPCSSGFMMVASVAVPIDRRSSTAPVVVVPEAGSGAGTLWRKNPIAMLTAFYGGCVSDGEEGDAAASSSQPEDAGGGETTDYELDPSWNPDDNSVSSSEHVNDDPFQPSSESRLFQADDRSLLNHNRSTRSSSYRMEPLEIPPEPNGRRERMQKAQTPRDYLL